MSNAVLAVQVYTVTKESIPVCSKTTCMAHTGYSLIFWGCAGGAETSFTSKKLVDSGLARYN